VIYLNCPFTEKDQAKALGARWDKNTKQWYIAEGTPLEPFQKWLPKGIPLVQEKAASPDGFPQYTVRQFIIGLKVAFHELYPAEIWLMGQITKLKTRGEGIEIQLMDCESNLDLKNACAMTVAAWGDKSSFIINKMEQSGLQLQEGLLINVKIRPKFHQRYHVGGDVLDIDPAATLGEFALLQRQIREKLKQEGIYNKNKLLPQPFDFCQVAVIHPPNASGYHDFKKDADILQQLNLCHFEYYPSSFEGINAENELLAALEAALVQHIKSPIDAIVMIRGGGARQGLLNLVKETIVRKICLSPVPIMVGLGHADDKLLLDEVANISFDTPSKTIVHIRNTMQKNAREALAAFQDIDKISAQIVQGMEKTLANVFASIAWQGKTAMDKKAKQIAEYRQQIDGSSKFMLNKWQNNLLVMNHTLLNTKNIIATYTQKIAILTNQIFAAKQRIALQTQHKLEVFYNDIKLLSQNVVKQCATKLNYLNELIESLHPEAVLKRGYALAMDSTHKVIRSKKQATEQNAFLLKFKDGECSVKINEDK